MRGFSGINRGTSPFLTTEGELYDTRNLKTDKIGVLKKTGDYTLKNARITASQPILGGVDFDRATGTHEHFVAIDGGTNAGIYKDVVGTWTTQSQTLTKNYKVRFAYEPTLDTLFAVNFVDATRSYNGTSWSTSTNVTDAPKAKYVIPFGRRVYLLNTDISGTKYPTRAYRSSLVDSGSATWDVTNDWVTFDDVITGVGYNGENMFVGCQNSTHIFTLNDERYKIGSKGVVSADSIAWQDELTFYATRDGMYVYTGAKPQKLSKPVQDYWDAIPEANLSAIQAEIIGDYLYVYIGDITVDGESYSNVLFMYDISQNDWNKIELGEQVTDLHTYVTTTGKALFMGNDDGEVFQMFTGSAQNTVEFGSAFETHWIYGADPKQILQWEEVWVFGSKISGLQIFYKTDEQGWEPAGQLNSDADAVSLGDIKATRIKIRGQESSKNNMYEIYRADLTASPMYNKNKDREE